MLFCACLLSPSFYFLLLWQPSNFCHKPHFIKIKVQPSPLFQTPLVPEGFLLLHGPKFLLSASHLGTKTLDFSQFLTSYMELTVFHRMQDSHPQLPVWQLKLGPFHWSAWMEQRWTKILICDPGASHLDVAQSLLPLCPEAGCHLISQTQVPRSSNRIFWQHQVSHCGCLCSLLLQGALQSLLSCLGNLDSQRRA